MVSASSRTGGYGCPNDRLQEVAEAFGPIDAILHRPCLGLTAGELRDRVRPRRDGHIAELRAALDARYPETLAIVDRYVIDGHALRNADLGPFRLGKHEPEARALAGQFVAWHPTIACGEGISGRGCLSASRLAKLQLLKANDDDRFLPFRRFPLVARHPCERCGAEGELWVATPTGEGGAGFSCTSCAHVDGLGRDGLRLWCPCARCRDEREHARLRFQRETWPRARDAIERRLRDQVEVETRGDGAPTPLQMERDWVMQRSALSRVEAEVLALRPRSAEDLFRLADELEGHRRQQGRRRTVARAELLRKLLEHRVVYRVRHTDRPAPAPESLVVAYLTENAELVFRRSDGRRAGYSTGCEFWGVGREAERVLASGGDAEFWPALGSGGSIRGTAPVESVADDVAPRGGRVEWCVTIMGLPSPRIRNVDHIVGKSRDALLLNPFAAQLGDTGTTRVAGAPTVVAGVRKKVIASPSEQAELVRLQARFPQGLVVPQLPLMTAIDLDDLAGHLPQAAIRYLKWSRVDFGVIDPDTYELLRVVEVQVGAHHDTSDQEQKDRWKREACALAGIEFEEVM